MHGTLLTDAAELIYSGDFSGHTGEGELVKKQSMKHNLHERSPTLPEFPKKLWPEHKNAHKAKRSGNFSHRFRVQLASKPATTGIKTGHHWHESYFKRRSLLYSLRSCTVPQSDRARSRQIADLSGQLLF
jgi:hypothetical protein